MIGLYHSKGFVHSGPSQTCSSSIDHIRERERCDSCDTTICATNPPPALSDIPGQIFRVCRNPWSFCSIGRGGFTPNLHELRSLKRSRILILCPGRGSRHLPQPPHVPNMDVEIHMGVATVHSDIHVKGCKCTEQERDERERETVPGVNPRG